MSEVIPIVRLPRRLSREMAEEHCLFLCRSTANLTPASRTRREALEQLSRSPNAAVASEALRLLAPLRMLKLSALEKLARRLCWLGFGPSGRKGKTEASYWAALPKETHRSYIDEAALLCSNMRQIMKTEGSQAALWNAMTEADRRRAHTAAGAQP